MLRQIITDTLTNPPHQRPLPEAWTYVLGHAIEKAQHHQKTAAPAPVSVAPEAPPTPVVHSRPPPAHQRHRPHASTPPPPPPPPPRPTPPPPTTSKGNAPLLIGGGVAVVAIIALIVAVVALSNRNNPAPASTPRHQRRTYPSDTDASAPTSTWAPPAVSVRPPLVETPDSYGVSCPNGYQVPGHSGWATSAGRGADGTSCQFASNVLLAYWNSYPSPSRDSRQVIAPGTVPCPNVSSNCSGNDFIMTCAVNGNDPWITCTGGHEADHLSLLAPIILSSAMHLISQHSSQPRCSNDLSTASGRFGTTLGHDCHRAAVSRRRLGDDGAPRSGPRRRIAGCFGALVLLVGCVSAATIEAPTAPAASLAGTSIFLDPGHNGVYDSSITRQVKNGRGGTKPCNTTGTATNDGYAEHAFTWDVTLRIRDALNQLGAHTELPEQMTTRWGPASISAPHRPTRCIRTQS